MKNFFTIHLPAILLLIITAGCLGPVRDLYPEDIYDRPVPIYIISHGWHAGIAIESAYIKEFLPEHEEMPEAHYLKFGWGDGRYYPHPDPGFRTLLSAALLPTRSVIQVVGVDIPLDRYFSASTIVKVQITEEGAREFAEFVNDRFREGSDGNIRKAADGIYLNSAFFEANGRYYLPKTSNIWTARALRKTGYPITSIYSFTSGNVVRQARRDGEVVQ